MVSTVPNLWVGQPKKKKKTLNFANGGPKLRTSLANFSILMTDSYRQDSTGSCVSLETLVVRGSPLLGSFSAVDYAWIVDMGYAGRPFVRPVHGNLREWIWQVSFCPLF